MEIGFMSYSCITHNKPRFFTLRPFLHFFGDCKNGGLQKRFCTLFIFAAPIYNIGANVQK